MTGIPLVFDRLAHTVLVGGAKKVTRFISPKLTVKCTYQGKRRSRRDPRHATVLFTIGAANYAERKSIKKAKKLGTAFPFTEVKYK